MQVPLSYVFSRNKKIGSRLISWSTAFLSQNNKYCPSHVALLINNRWVFESTLETGVVITTFDKWSKNNEIVAQIKEDPTDYSTIKKHFKSIKNKKYDWLGVCYLGLRIALRRLFKRPIPQTNKWEDPNKYFCCEVVGELLNENFDMKAPVQVLDFIMESKKLNQ